MTLIDGDKLADSIKDKLCEHLYCWDCSMCLEDGGCKIEKWLDDAPSIDIEPKRGEWKIEEANSVWGKGYLLTCSECGESFRVTETALPYEHFCRNCGARMDGEREGE